MNKYQFNVKWEDDKLRIFRLKLDIFKFEIRNPEIVIIMLNPGSFGQNGTTDKGDPTLREIIKVMEAKGIQNAVVYNLFNICNGNKSEFLRMLKDNLDNDFLFFKDEEILKDCEHAKYIIPAWGVLESKMVKERGDIVFKMILEKFDSKLIGVKKFDYKQDINFFHPRLMNYYGYKSGVGVWKQEILKMMK